MLIAQLSDPHVRAGGRLAYGVADTGAFLERAVDALLALAPRPDLVLVTGDLAHDGLQEEYGTARAALDRLPMPVAVVPGNHDHRDRLRAAFPIEGFAHPHPRFVQFAVDAAGPVRVLALDTLVPGQPHGELCPGRLAWLEERLAEAPDRPTVLALHHPPIRTGIAHMDAINCRNADALGVLVRRRPNVERLLCGHLHRPIQARWQGTLVTVAPSVAHQVALDLGPDAPAAFVMEPPACLLHRWTEATGLVTHQAYVGGYPGPYAFDEQPAEAARRQAFTAPWR